MQHSQAVELAMFLTRYCAAAAAALCMSPSSTGALSLFFVSVWNKQ